MGRGGNSRKSGGWGGANAQGRMLGEQKQHRSVIVLFLFLNHLPACWHVLNLRSTLVPTVAPDHSLLASLLLS